MHAASYSFVPNVANPVHPPPSNVVAIGTIHLLVNQHGTDLMPTQEALAEQLQMHTNTVVRQCVPITFSMGSRTVPCFRWMVSIACDIAREIQVAVHRHQGGHSPECCKGRSNKNKNLRKVWREKEHIYLLDRQQGKNCQGLRKKHIDQARKWTSASVHLDVEEATLQWIRGMRNRTLPLNGPRHLWRGSGIWIQPQHPASLVQVVGRQSSRASTGLNFWMFSSDRADLNSKSCTR